MNRSLLYAALTCGVIILGAAGIIMVRSYRAQGTSPVALQNQTQENIATTEQKSLKDLMATSQPQTCTFSDASGNQGTVYVGNAKMRGDFVTTAAGQATNAHMIVADQTSYMWMEGQSTGFKMSFDTTATADQNPNGQNTVDVNKKSDYSCTNWTVDPSFFNPPTDIQFTDFGKVSVPTTSAGNSGTPLSTKEQQCAVCNSLPAASQAECRASLSCE